MKELKVCFAGVGSIAKRHIRNLGEICLKRGIELHMDAYRHNGGEAENLERIFTDIEQVPDDYDIVFITNPTDLHLTALKDFHHKGRHFFIEKPVVAVSQLTEAIGFLTKPDAVYYVACPLRYNAVIQYLKKEIDPEDVISVRSISSSYLPDWRPGQDYRKTYSANKAMGGGVSTDLIHEWDYLTYLFGWPKKMCCMIGKKSALEIDSDDYAIYIAEFENMIGELHLDYFGRQTIRTVELFTKDETIRGDIANHKISFLKAGKEIEFHEERDDYQIRELEHFLDLMDGRVPKEDGFSHGLRVLKLTQGTV